MRTRTLQLTESENEVLERAAHEAGKSVDALVSDLIGLLDERRRLVAEGLADGRTVDNAAMKKWLETWGTDDEQDPPS